MDRVVSDDQKPYIWLTLPWLESQLVSKTGGLGRWVGPGVKLPWYSKKAGAFRQVRQDSPKEVKTLIWPMSMAGAQALCIGKHPNLQHL